MIYVQVRAVLYLTRFVSCAQVPFSVLCLSVFLLQNWNSNSTLLVVVLENALNRAWVGVCILTFSFAFTGDSSPNSPFISPFRHRLRCWFFLFFFQRSCVPRLLAFPLPRSTHNAFNCYTNGERRRNLSRKTRWTPESTDQTHHGSHCARARARNWQLRRWTHHFELVYRESICINSKLIAFAIGVHQTVKTLHTKKINQILRKLTGELTTPTDSTRRDTPHRRSAVWGGVVGCEGTAGCHETKQVSMETSFTWSCEFALTFSLFRWVGRNSPRRASCWRRGPPRAESQSWFYARFGWLRFAS